MCPERGKSLIGSKQGFIQRSKNIPKELLQDQTQQGRKKRNDPSEKTQKGDKKNTFAIRNFPENQCSKCFCP